MLLKHKRGINMLYAVKTITCVKENHWSKSDLHIKSVLFMLKIVDSQGINLEGCFSMKIYSKMF